MAQGERKTGSFEVSSLLAAPRERVWERVTTPAGVNDELRPLVRMRFPRALEGLESAPTGEVLGRCWLLLFGVLPVDYDDVTLVTIAPPGGFLERSPLLSMRWWQHERTLEPTAEGRCLIRDAVSFEPRGGLPGAPLVPLYRAVFRHRHRRLRQRFGGSPAA